MLDFRTETLFDVIDEVRPLLEAHYEALTLNKDRVKLDPMWERYAALEAAGAFVVFTARDEAGKLVGYSAFFIQHHLHYAALKTAINDVLWLAPEQRRGVAGIRLIRYCEQQLMALGVDKLTWHIKFSLDWRPILNRMGYVDEEVVVSKYIGQD